MKPILAATVIALLAAPAQAAPALWRISDADSSIWIFGSFHVLPSDTEWRTETFDQVLEQASAVMFETDISPAAQATVGATAFARGIYTDGTLLSDVVDEEIEALMREAAEASNIPYGTILAMRPWMAANAISLAVMIEAGLTMEGVETTLDASLPEDFPRLQLETGDEQIEVLAGAPEDEQIAMLDATVRELHILPKVLDKMITAWLDGTPEDLGHLFLMEMGGFEEAFLERLLYARNRNWIEPLTGLLEQNEPVLVVVGAAHLIGDGSVLDLMADKGLTIERIQ